jgi:uncharacterized protein (TIGR03000 family)
MLRQRYALLPLAVAGLAELLAAQPAAAQYPVGDRRSEMTVGRSYYESQGPGYSLYIPSAAFAGRYYFTPGMYTGAYAPTRFATSSGYYATQASGYSPIMFTSLYYPGIYGAYAHGPGAATWNVGPHIQTVPDNRPSDNPVGAPYAPQQRPLMEVPLNARIGLSSQPDLRAQPALIDVFLPAQATLTFQGVLTTQEGGVREFQSPPLEPGRTYTYDIRATWRTEDGREVKRTQQLKVSAGNRATVDFNRETVSAPGEPESQRSALRAQPLPMQRDRRPEPNP